MSILKNCIKKALLVEAFRRQRARARADMRDLFALGALSPLNAPYLPWTSSSLRPGAMRLVANEIIIHRRKEIIEFGSGISTVYLGLLLKKYGGRLISVDSDSGWRDTVKAVLEDVGVASETVRLQCVSLADFQGTGHFWYEEHELDTALGDRLFDLALVDGPVSSRNDLTVRMPAGAFLSTRLSSDFAVFLDDIQRPGEARIARGWADAFGWMRTDLLEHGGIALFRPKGCKAYNIV